MHYVGRRASETNPLRSIPFIRPAAVVTGTAPQRAAEWALTAARQEVANREMWVAHYCRALGDANRVRGSMRRHWQAKAFRGINTYRAELRRARKALIAAETAMLAFTPAMAA